MTIEEDTNANPVDDNIDEDNAEFAAAFNESGDDYEEISNQLDTEIAHELQAEQAATSEQAENELSETQQEATQDGDVQEQAPQAHNDFEQQLAQLRAENQRLQHRLASDDGRTSALQRKINELEKRLEERNDPQKVAVDNEAIKLLKEDYPDIAEAIEASVQMQVEQANQAINARVQEALTPIQQAEQERLFSIQQESLANAHPDYQQLNDDPNYWAWVAQQSPARQQAATSSDAVDVIETLNLYKYSTGYKPSSETQEPVSDKRQQQLAAMQGVPSTRGSGHRMTAAKDDFAAGFNS